MRGLTSCLMLLAVSFPCLVRANPPATPENVLPYLEEVYEKGDIEAYADLLAEDYRFTLEDMEASWDAATDIRGTRQLFEAAKTELSFEKGFSIKPGLQAGTWVIEDVKGSLTVSQKKDGKIWKVENTFSFVVRDEDGKMRITEWRQHPSE